jgi:hypothetical protein
MPESESHTIGRYATEIIHYPYRNYGLVYFNFYVLRQETGRQNIPNWMVQVFAKFRLLLISCWAWFRLVSQIHVSCHLLKLLIDYPHILNLPAFCVTRHEPLLSFFLKELFVFQNYRSVGYYRIRYPTFICACNQRRWLWNKRGGGRAKFFPAPLY